MKTKHINEEQIAMVADALNCEDMSTLPEEVKEHIAECNECANKALIVSELSSDIILNSSITNTPKRKSNFLKYSILILAAASIVILFLVFFIQRPLSTERNMANLNDSLEILKQNDTINPLLDSKYIVKEKLKESSNDNLIAFNENIDFEKTFLRFKNSEMRNSQLNIISKQVIKTNTIDDLILEWTKPDSPLTIEIFDNQGNKIMSKETSNCFMNIDCMEKEGLYYWKVLDEDFNIIYIGKIIYKK